MAKLAMARSRAVIVALALLFVQLQVRDVDAWAADGHHITCLIAEVYGSLSLLQEQINGNLDVYIVTQKTHRPLKAIISSNLQNSIL